MPLAAASVSVALVACGLSVCWRAWACAGGRVRPCDLIIRCILEVVGVIEAYFGSA